MSCIVSNTLVLAVHWYGMPETLSEIFEITNMVFMVVFALEAVMKIIAMKKQYFKDNWNVFDFVVVVSTLLAIIST